MVYLFRTHADCIAACCRLIFAFHLFTRLPFLLTFFAVFLQFTTANALVCRGRPALLFFNCDDNACNEAFMVRYRRVEGECQDRPIIISAPSNVGAAFRTIKNAMGDTTVADGFYKVTFYPSCLRQWDAYCTRSTNIKRMSESRSAEALKTLRDQWHKREVAEFLDVQFHVWIPVHIMGIFVVVLIAAPLFLLRRRGKFGSLRKSVIILFVLFQALVAFAFLKIVTSGLSEWSFLVWRILDGIYAVLLAGAAIHLVASLAKKLRTQREVGHRGPA